MDVALAHDSWLPKGLEAEGKAERKADARSDVGDVDSTMLEPS